MDDRIVLWRNTFQLFYESNKPQKYIGPFKKAGFSKMVVDRPFMTTDSRQVIPDIVASSEHGWVTIEITTRPSSKEGQLNSYASIDPRGLSNYGLPSHTDAPDVISSRLSPIADGSYCQLILKDNLRLQNESCIKNPILRDALLSANGLELRKLPSISIVLVPEMSAKSKELCRGIFDTVMQLFDTNCEGKTIAQIVQEGLDKIADCISFEDRSRLESAVKVQMDDLVKNHLSGFIEFDEINGLYKGTNKNELRSNTKGLVTRKMREWAALGPQKELSEFSENET